MAQLKETMDIPLTEVPRRNTENCVVLNITADSVTEFYERLADCELQDFVLSPLKRLAIVPESHLQTKERESMRSLWYEYLEKRDV